MLSQDNKLSDEILKKISNCINQNKEKFENKSADELKP